MQFSAQTLGPIGEDDTEAVTGETFIDFMNRTVAAHVANGVPKDMAERQAEDAWFTAETTGADSWQQPAAWLAEQEGYLQSIGFTPEEAAQAATDEWVEINGEPAWS